MRVAHELRQNHLNREVQKAYIAYNLVCVRVFVCEFVCLCVCLRVCVALLTIYELKGLSPCCWVHPRVALR
jgi:hypothetical protein